MKMNDFLDTVRGFDGALVVVPGRGGTLPEIAWGDAFCFYAPDGQMPQTVQPYATAVTKDYPDDTASQLGGGRWRLNINAGRAAFTELTGEQPRSTTASWDYAAADTVLPHPVYGELGWICIVTPGPRTRGTALQLLRDAHAAARARAERRSGTSG